MLEGGQYKCQYSHGMVGRDFWEPLFEPSLANPDRELRHWRVDYSKKCVDLANFIGAPCISVTSGRCAPNFDPETSMGFLLESLTELVEYAEKRSIRIGIEYEPGLLVERYEELAIAKTGSLPMAGGQPRSRPQPRPG